MSEFTIRISVKSAYLDEYSQPHKNRFAFSYTVSIENCSDMSAQLLSRHWVITDAKDKIQEVSGDGVIGEQPHIAPGKKYTYSSNAILETHAGIMEGSYTMRTEAGTVIQVPIPAFSLTRPQSLH
ncbi:Co2+/Mg2+ efflux protein ApaG [Eionea flava]